MAPKARISFELLPLTPTVNLARMFCYGQFHGPWLLQITGSLLLTIITVWLAIFLWSYTDI